jgi:hypothetical protein
MVKKPRKPTGTSGPNKITAGSDPEFVRLKFPETKAEIEELMLSGAITAAKARNIDVYSLTEDPRHNDENNFDFDLPTSRGVEHLDLAEIALLKKRGGYTSGATVFPVGDFADAVFELIKAKDRKYGLSRNLPVHLLLYSTDWRFLLSESVITLVQLFCARKQHRFRSILYYAPITEAEGIAWQLYPSPLGPVEVAAVSELVLRGKTLHQADPTAIVATPDKMGATFHFPDIK